MVSFSEFLKKKNVHSGQGIDLGAGRGRNSFFLAQLGFSMLTLDLLQENAEAIQRESSKKQLQIQAHFQDVSDPWPVQPHSLAFAIDIFCYKHIVDKTKQKSYRRQLHKALKQGGFYLISLASEKDGFYGPLLATSPDPQKKMIVDPVSKIASFLYTQEEIVEEFKDVLTLVEAEEKTSVSPMYGKEYPRTVLNLIFKK